MSGPWLVAMVVALSAIVGATAWLRDRSRSEMIILELVQHGTVTQVATIQGRTPFVVSINVDTGVVSRRDLP